MLITLIKTFPRAQIHAESPNKDQNNFSPRIMTQASSHSVLN